MTVLTISQDTLIQLPDGANGGRLDITYNGTTVGSVIASGDDQGKAVITTGRLAKLTALDGVSPVKIVGREARGRLPASVTLRIYPNYPAGVLGPTAPITLTGRPLGAYDAPGIWDLSNIEDSSGGMDVITASERQALAVLKERTGIAAAAAEVAGSSATLAATGADTAAAQALTQSGATRFVDDAERTANPRPPGTWSYTVTTNMLHRFEGSAWAVKGPGVASLPAVQAAALTANQAASLSASIDVGLQIAAKATLTDTPRRVGENRRIADGSIWDYSATGTPDATGASFGTVQAQTGGGYWRRQYQTRSVEFYGAVDCPDGAPKVNSSIAFGLAMAALPYGATLIGNGTYYLGNTWEINRDDVTIRMSGMLKPMPGMTAHLVFIPPLPDSIKRWGAYSAGNPWQANIKITQLNLNGLHQCKGLWMRGRDHWTLTNVHIRKTFGNALRLDAVREGNLHDCEVITCQRGPDKGVVEFLDTTVLADANNTNRCYNLRIIFGIGTQLYQDTPYVLKGPAGEVGNGSITRLMEMYGTQIETSNQAQLSLGFADAPGGVPVPDWTEDIVAIRMAESMDWIGGHIFVGRLDTPAGGTAAGGAVIRLGNTNDVPNQRPNRVNNFRLNSTKMFVGETGTPANVPVLLARHNCDRTEFEPVRMNNEIASFEWVNGAVGGGNYAARQGTLRVVREAQSAAFNAEGVPGAASSAAYEMTLGTQKAAQFLDNSGAVVLQSDRTLTSRLLVKGGSVYSADDGMARLGLTAAPFFGLHLAVFAAEPGAPLKQTGLIVLANGASWNPLARGAGGPAYAVRYDGSAWRSIA